MKKLFNDAYYKLAFKWNNFLAPAKTQKERGDQLTEVLGLVIIALIILVLFREEIVKAANNVIKEITGKLDKVFSPDIATGTGG